MRRAVSIDSLIPVLYLKGISSNDFTIALESILSPKLIPRALEISNYWEGIFKRCGWEKTWAYILIGYCDEGDQSKGERPWRKV